MDRLELFAPFAGPAYRNERNFDYGPLDRSNVSTLSPWISHRLITEKEICKRVMRDFTLQTSEKFIQEIFWRTYWKGWMEMRPYVWADYESDKLHAFKKMEGNTETSRDYQAAIAGKTGIDCFDSWAKELVETGYLHNHGRMWFASIWIFTLRLDWKIGADFFLTNLMDADAASNTLSWRWVAGLQTKGKHYLARASNIAKYTHGRFDPKGLNESAQALPDDYSFDALQPLRSLSSLPTGQKAMLLIHEDDCVPEQLDFGSNEICLVARWNLSDRKSVGKVGHIASQFTKHALDDAVDRAASRYNVATQTFDSIHIPEDILLSAKNAQADCIITAFAPQGWTREPINQLAAKCRNEDIGFYEIRRAWDANAWPCAKKGFFSFNAHIPQLMIDAGLNIGEKQ